MYGLLEKDEDFRQYGEGYQKTAVQTTLTSLDNPSQENSLVGNTKNPNVDDQLSNESEYGCELKPLYRSRRMDNSL